MSRGDDQDYPVVHEPRPGERETLWGMTIRERFAMAAMQGMLMCRTYSMREESSPTGGA